MIVFVLFHRKIKQVVEGFKKKKKNVILGFQVILTRP